MKLTEKTSSLLVIFIIIATSLVFTINLNYIDITIMEARNFVTAREMLIDNNWFMPTFNGEPRYQKPPLPTWITALSTTIFGVKTLYFYRLPSFLFVAATAITSYYFSLELIKNKKDSLMNSFITLTSFYIIAIALEAPWDIYSHGFMFIAIYFLYKCLNSNIYSIKNIMLISILIGCSFLSKGPISVYALLLPFLIAYFITYPNLKKEKLKKIIPILITGVIIGLSWYTFIFIEDPTNLIYTTKKETSNWANYNVRPFYYYWSFFIQSGIWTIFAFLSLLYPYYKNKIKNYKAYKMTFLWTIIGVTLLSLIPEKKPRYLMPVLIPLAMNIGFIFRYIINSSNQKKSSKKVLQFHYLLILIIGSSFFIIKSFILDLTINLFDIILVILSISVIIKLLNKNNLTFLNVKIMSLLIVLFSMTNAPTLVKKTNDQYRSVSELNSLKIETYSNYDISPEIIWDFGRVIKKISTKEIKEITVNNLNFGLLTKKPLIIKDTLFNNQKYRVEKITKYDLNRGKRRKRLITYYHLFSAE